MDIYIINKIYSFVPQHPTAVILKAWLNDNWVPWFIGPATSCFPPNFSPMTCDLRTYRSKHQRFSCKFAQTIVLRIREVIREQLPEWEVPKAVIRHPFPIAIKL